MIDDINHIIDRIVVERSKQIDSAIFGEIQEIAIENGIETRIKMNETAIVDALKKQIPKKPLVYNIFQRHCECGAILKVYYKYCYECGQAIDWSGE